VRISRGPHRPGITVAEMPELTGLVTAPRKPRCTRWRAGTLARPANVSVWPSSLVAWAVAAGRFSGPGRDWRPRAPRERGFRRP